MNWDISTAEGMSNAIAWTERHLTRVRAGGLWIVPRSRSVYRILPEAREVVRVEGGDRAVERVLYEMGWKVRDGLSFPLRYNPQTQRGII